MMTTRSKIIWIAIFISTAGLLLYLASVGQEKPAPPEQAAAIAATPNRASVEASQLVYLMIEQKILRVDSDQRQAWISPQAWLEFDARAKEGLALAVATYVSPGTPMVTIYDAQSARELASYGPFQGFEVK